MISYQALLESMEARRKQILLGLIAIAIIVIFIIVLVYKLH